jgi:glycopeptide antibiotics resistance protein
VAAPSTRVPRIFFALSALFIVYATTVPFDFAHRPSIEKVSLIPYFDGGRFHSIPDTVQNIALFLPFGFFAVIAFQAAIFPAAVLGLSLSFFVESLQTMSQSRTPSASDLANNMLGAAVGAAIGRVWIVKLEARFVRAVRELAQRQPGLIIVVLLAIACGLSLLAPFIPTLDVGMLRHKVRLLLDHPLGTREVGALGMDAVLFGALAFAATIELRPRASRAEAALVAGPLTAAYAVMLEIGQLPLVHHNPGAREAAANVAGALTGALIAVLVSRNEPSERGLGRWSKRWPALVLGFAILLPLLRALAPFHLLPLDQAFARLEGRRFLPFWSLFVHITMSTFTNVFEAAATYIPIGWVLAARGLRPGLIFGLALVLAELLEVLQIPIATRTFDVTEGLLAAPGALLGAWAFVRLVEISSRR